MEDVTGHTFIVDAQDVEPGAGHAQPGGTGIEIAIVNGGGDDGGGSVELVDSSGNPLGSTREDDVIAVLGQLFESAEDTLQQMAEQMATKEGVEEAASPKEGSLTDSGRSRSHVCECGKAYTTKSHLRYHQKVHSNRRPYLCQWCDQTFLQLGHLKRHLRVHTRDRPFACDLCDKTFRQNSHLTCHRRIHTDEKPYACQVCGMTFRQKTAVYRHASRRHVAQKDYHCALCGKCYSSATDLHRHEKTHVSITYFAVLNLRTNTSQICGHIESDEPLIAAPDEPGPENKENASQQQQQQQQQQLDEAEVIRSVVESFNLPSLPSAASASAAAAAARPYKCQICNKTYKSKGHLKFHAKVHLAERPFKCPYCAKGFIQKGHLRRHVLCHTEEKPFVCTACGKVFRQVSHLNDHRKIHENLRPNVCYVCGKGFRQTSALKRHMIRMHATRKAYGCPDCGKRYRLESDLKRHRLATCGKEHAGYRRRGHRESSGVVANGGLGDPNPNSDEASGDKTSTEPGVILTRNGNKRAPYRHKCDVCRKPCRSQTELKIHMRTHTDERPYQCGICHKVFKLLPHLNDHMRIHTGERPFVCRDCGHRFRRESALRRHAIRMHSAEKRHVCEACGKAYASAVDLRRHRRSHLTEEERGNLPRKRHLAKREKEQRKRCRKRTEKIKKQLSRLELTPESAVMDPLPETGENRADQIDGDRSEPDPPRGGAPERVVDVAVADDATDPSPSDPRESSIDNNQLAAVETAFLEESEVPAACSDLLQLQQAVLKSAETAASGDGADATRETD